MQRAKHVVDRMECVAQAFVAVTSCLCHQYKIIDIDVDGWVSRHTWSHGLGFPAHLLYCNGIGWGCGGQCFQPMNRKARTLVACTQLIVSQVARRFGQYGKVWGRLYPSYWQRQWEGDQWGLAWHGGQGDPERQDIPRRNQTH